ALAYAKAYVLSQIPYLNPKIKIEDSIYSVNYVREHLEQDEESMDQVKHVAYAFAAAFLAPFFLSLGGFIWKDKRTTTKLLADEFLEGSRREPPQDVARKMRKDGLKGIIKLGSEGLI